MTAPNNVPVRIPAVELDGQDQRRWGWAWMHQHPNFHIHYWQLSCHRHNSEYWWHCHTYLHQISMERNTQQWAHEVRDIAEFNDWVGRELGFPILMQDIRNNYKHAPPMVKFEQRTDGTSMDKEGWILYKNWTDLQLRQLPQQSDRGYSTWCQIMQHYSWEKRKTCTPIYHGQWYDQQQMHGDPAQVYWGFYDRWVHYGNEEDLRFPRNIRAFRWRQNGKGQPIQSFTWYFSHQFNVMTLWNKLIHIRSPFKDPLGAPVCLVDRAPQWRDGIRELQGMNCGDAANVADGREVWRMASAPVIYRWENDNSAICYRDDIFPWVTACGDENSESQHVEIFYENSLRMLSNKKCITIKDQETTQTCGLNCNATASSTYKMKDNTPCGPLNKKPTKFRWMPNDKNMKQTISFQDRFTILTKMEIEFWNPPKIFKIVCFSDVMNTQQDIAQVKTMGMTTFKFEFDPEPCINLTLTVLELEPETQKCEQGLCSGLNRVSIMTRSMATAFAEQCDEKDESQLKKRWFLEPADVSQMGNIRRTKFDYIANKSTMIQTMTAMQFVKRKLKEMDEEFPSMMTADFAEDLLFELEACEKGPCLDSVKKPNLPVLQKELMEVKGRFGKLAVVAHFDGETKTKPADSCSYVNMVANTEVNGFYWIKNKCSKDAHKVQCDFSEKPQTGYIVDNQHEFNGINIRETSEMHPDQFVAQCMHSGFQLADTETVEDLETLVILAFTQGFNLNKEAGILVGYDQSCHKNEGCQGKWQSLDGSMELTPVAKKFNQSISKDFVGIKGNEALILSGGVVKTVSFSGSKINSIPCKTNFENQPKFVPCSATFSDLETMDAEFVQCEPSCINSGMPLFGVDVQSANSSVCMAIIHSGNSDPRGSYLFSKVTPQKALLNGFKSEARNGLTSKISALQMKGYSISTDNDAEHECPDAKVAAIKSIAFLQNINIDTSKLSKSEMDMIQNIINAKNKPAQDLEEGTFSTGNSSGPTHSRNDFGPDTDAEAEADTDAELEAHRSPEPEYQDDSSKFGNNNDQEDTNDGNHKIYLKNDNVNIKQQPTQRFSGSRTSRVYDDASSPNSSVGDEEEDQGDMREQQASSLAEPMSAHRNWQTHKSANTNARQRHFHTDKQNAKRFKYDGEWQNRIQYNRDQMPKGSIRKPMTESLKVNLKHLNSNRNVPKWAKKTKQTSTGVKASRSEQVVQGYKVDQNNNMKMRPLNVPKPNAYFVEQKLRNKDTGSEEDSISTNPSEDLNAPELKGFKKKEKIDQGIKIDPTKSFKSQLKQMQRFSEREGQQGREDESIQQRTRNDEVEHTIDVKKFFKSDEDKAKKKYQKRTKLIEMENQKFWTLKGDDTQIMSMYKAINDGNIVENAKEMADEWRIIFAHFMKLMGEDNASLVIHEKLQEKYLQDYNLLNVFGVAVVRTANKELANAIKALWMMEDKYLSLFKQIDVDQVVDIVQGVSIPLPDTWQIETPNQTDGDPNFKITKQDTAPHQQAIILDTEVTLSQEKDAAVFLITRYHKIFDGSFHVSFKVPGPDKKGTYGFLWRQNDMFNHQGIKFIVQTGELYVQLLTPYQFKVLYKEKYSLNIDAWYRLVIDTYRYIFKIQLIAETTTPPEEMSKTLIAEELISHPTFTVQHAGLKEGKIGFMCNDCKGFMLSSIWLVAAACWIKPNDYDQFFIRSPKGSRQVENFKPNLEAKFSTWIPKQTQEPGAWIQTGPIDGKINGVSNTTEATWMNGFISPAQVAYYSDRDVWCRDQCEFQTLLQFKGKKGCIGVGVKWKTSDLSQWVVLSKGKKKNHLYLVQGVKSPKKLDKIELPSMNEDEWIHILIRIKGNKIDVNINKKVMQKEYVIFELNINEGTMAFGTNNIIGVFTAMKLRTLTPPKPPGKKIIVKIIEEKEEGEAPELQGEDYEEEEEEEEEVETNEEKEKDREYKCLESREEITRNQQCEEMFGGHNQNSEVCVNTFCSICCSTESAQVLTCVNNCEGETIKVEINKLDVDFCLNQTGENDGVKLQQCKKCCYTFDVKIYGENSIGDCNKACYEKFDVNLADNPGHGGVFLTMAS